MGIEILIYIFLAFIAGIVFHKSTYGSERDKSIDIFYEDELVVTLKIASIEINCIYNYDVLQTRILEEAPFLKVNVVGKQIHNTILYEEYIKQFLAGYGIMIFTSIPLLTKESKWAYKINI